MRKFMPLLALICSLHLAAAAPEEPAVVEIDSFDYSSMLQVSSTILSKQFGARLEEIMEQGGDAQLIPANDDEKAALAVAFTYFLIAFARMHQEAACLAGQENALEMLNTVWSQGSAVFGLMPEELQRAAVGMAMEWIEEHAEDEWQPVENAEHYKPASEWDALRKASAQQYYQFLGQALEEA